MRFDKTIGKYVDKKVLAALSDFLEKENYIPPANIVASAFGAGEGLFPCKDADFEEKLISSFQRNLSLLIQKTWVEKADAELKETVLYKLTEYCDFFSKGKWGSAYPILLQIVSEVVYLMFGNQARSSDFAEYALRIDPGFGLFWLYIGNLPKEQTWQEEKQKTAMLLGMYFLANY